MVVVAVVLLIGPYTGEEVSKYISFHRIVSHRTGREGGRLFLHRHLFYAGTCILYDRWIKLHRRMHIEHH
jgi:hypothetical protein